VRDATYEEVFHLVQGDGIVDALPAFHAEIVEATEAAVAAEKYFYDDNPQRPLEYIITGVDVYYGLWAHDPDGNGHAFGPEYIYNTREKLASGDPTLYELVESYWPKYLKYDVYLDPSFEGTFSLVLDENQVYTRKSRYLVDIRLTGDKQSNLLGNGQDNTFLGNAGDNALTGGKGDDTLDGGPGDDTAVFTGDSAEYEIKGEGEKTIVTDKVEDRDGTDVLMNIENMQFKDKRVSTGDGS
jgi:Ca2+-binding RTX toxin-like protein